LCSGVAPLIGLLASLRFYTVIPFGPSQAVSEMNIAHPGLCSGVSLAVLALWCGVGFEFALSADRRAAVERADGCRMKLPWDWRWCRQC